MRPTHKDAAVIYVDGDGKIHDGVITDVFTPGAGRITLGDKGSVQASYSEKGEPGTFHYPDQSEAIQKKAAPKGKPQPPAANAPAQSAAAQK
jgi:hypothetical protein